VIENMLNGHRAVNPTAISGTQQAKRRPTARPPLAQPLGTRGENAAWLESGALQLFCRKNLPQAEH
jgi:hypothetical protein